MYKRLWMAVALFIIGLFSSVAILEVEGQGALPGYDWCFQFDFTANSYNIEPSFGSWDGGFKTDNSGFVGFVYSQARTVEPAQVVITYERRTLDDSQVIDVQASANIFGIGHVPDPVLFTFDTEASGGEFEDVQFMLLTPQSAGQSGTTMFVSAQSNQPIAITAVDVYGYGLSPFTGLPGIESCSASTATASPSPTFSYADCALWDQEFDFEVSGQGFYTIGPGAYQSGSGWQPGLEAGGRHLDIAINLPGTLQIGRVEYEILAFPGSSNAVLFFVGDTEESATYLGGAANITGSGIVSRTINGSASGNKLYVYSDNMYSAGGGGGPSYIVKKITIYGTGVNPYTGEYVSCTTVTPTPLPENCLVPGQPSPTPNGTPTNTPVPGFSGNRTYSISGSGTSVDGFSPSGRFSEGGRVYVNATFNQSITLDTTINPLPAGSYIYQIAFPGQGFYSGIANTVTVTLGTQSVTVGANATISSYSVATFPFDVPVSEDATITMSPDSGTYFGLNTEVIVYYRGGSFATPPPSTETPLPNCTPTPSMTPTGTIQPSNTPTPFTLTPTPSRTATATSIPLVLPTLASTSTPRPATGTPNPLTPTATVINLEPSVTTTFALPGSGGGAGQPNPFESAGDVRYMGEQVMAYGANAWRKATGWVQGFSSTTSGLVSAWGTAPAIMPPGLPQCVSDPLISQLCAIWWILENTIFSGTLGSIIITPIAVSIVYMLMIFQFIKLVRGILYRVGEIRK